MRVSKIDITRNGRVSEVRLSNGELLEGVLNAGLHMEPGEPVRLVLYVDLDEDAFQVLPELPAAPEPAAL